MPAHRRLLAAPVAASLLLLVVAGVTAVAGATTTHPSHPTAPAREATHRVRTPAPALPADAAARVAALADDYVKSFFTHFPDQATAQGRADADNSRLPDNSLQGLEDWREEEDALLDELETVEPARLQGRAKVTYEFLHELLAAAIGQRVCESELWNVSPTWTGWQANEAYLASIQPVGTPALRKAALERWSSLPRYLEQEEQRLRDGVRRGYTAPKQNVQRVIEQMDGLLAGPVTDSPFYDPAKRDSDPVFDKAMARVVEKEIRPAIRRYRTYLQAHYLSAAREAIAVAANPHGRDCYKAAIRFHTSIEMTPEEIHKVGLEQMDKVTAEMKTIGAKSFGTDDAPALLAKVKKPPYTFASRQEMVQHAQAAIERARQALPRWFGLVPRATVAVVPYPEFRERSAPNGEYQPGSDDNSRPGTYYINTYQPESVSRASLEATVFHETYPGHHVQQSIAKQVKDTHPIQRYFGNSGYVEGWALYSERLADEMSLYSDDVSRVGLLSNEALRAGRMVVDSGMHALGWSRQQAIDYLLAHTAETPERIAAEVDRYIAVPGQATAYMIGNLEIRRLRDQAQQELGERFRIQDFHDRVLEDGAVTLGMLREKIGRWIEEEKKTPAREPADGVGR